MVSFLGDAWKLAMELSPILLVDGVAAGITDTGGTLPIIAITEAAHFLSDILSGASNLELDDFFAHFQPMPGGTIIDNQIGNYPFANQQVAANAITAQPLTVSMQMICPARDSFGYPLKLATMIVLQKVLESHNAKGGTYTILTPSFVYTNGIMTGMRDISSQRSKQVQNTWQIDFQFPLLTVEAAAGVQNGLMAKLTNGTQVDSPAAWTNPANLTTTPGIAVPAFGP